MNSGNLKNYYSDYLEGTLGETDARKFEEILGRSPEIQADYELFVAAHQMVTRLPSEEADDQFDARVLSRIGKMRQVGNRGWFAGFLPSWNHLAAATAASLLVGISLAVFLQRQVGDGTTGVNPTQTAGRQASAGIPLSPASSDRDKAILHRKIGEISSLVEEINQLNERFQLGDEEILLGFSRDRELVLRPTEFYRRATQAAGRDPSAGDSVRHAY